jgi:ubiquinone/menaquinone biosynthesis C-methylase UbiE
LSKSEFLNEVLAENRSVRLLEPDIYSVLPEHSTRHHYDRRAALYDMVVGTRLYNSIMWGTSPRDFRAFVELALGSNLGGPFLDGGCGSLLFTAAAYSTSNRPIMAFDQSLAMLRRARKRLQNLSGGVPTHICLLQADLNDLPFKPQSFNTVLCLNVLHQFNEAADLFSNVCRLLRPDGRFYLTSLVINERVIGDWYLRALHLAREFVRPRTRIELRRLIETESFQSSFDLRVAGNMAFVSATLRKW